MQTLCDGWLAQTPRFRLLCWGGWMLVLIAAALLCLYPAEQQRKAQQAALVRQRVAIQEQWRNLYLLASSVEQPFSPSEARPVPFSPLVYQSSLTRLIHWQPLRTGRRTGAENCVGCGPTGVCPTGGAGDEYESVFS
ncbi:hypothetical protein [Citrobacter sp. Cpa228]|uniref:hypothetical protein n=1 Tax=Citrobacter sp. Cpa228 TaxID=2985119 RepID=UPI00257616F9|nr:hypothetical protein [Citrobacter sp. Cpa228]MDM2924113.1 cell division protein FtsL [Citrobacter sp. Cpa228]